MTSHPNVYKILNIPFSDTAPILSKKQIKYAYHKALLKHHPDKATNIPFAKPKGTGSSSVAAGDGTYTIDEITNAYKILADPELRAEYDRALRLQRKNQAAAGNDGLDVFHTGLEVVDLEDLDCSDSLSESINGPTTKNLEDNEDMLYWFRGCRCGDQKGFIVTEDELEAEAQHGEIVVGCRGCSLWIKVLFAVAEEE
jgi:diphthamide biosynthesis protein 4